MLFRSDCGGGIPGGVFLSFPFFRGGSTRRRTEYTCGVSLSQIDRGCAAQPLSIFVAVCPRALLCLLFTASTLAQPGLLLHGGLRARAHTHDWLHTRRPATAREERTVACWDTCLIFLSSDITRGLWASVVGDAGCHRERALVYCGAYQ